MGRYATSDFPDFERFNWLFTELTAQDTANKTNRMDAPPTEHTGATMIKEAKAYCSARRTVRKTPIYSANRFAKLIEDIPLTELCTEYLEQYRSRCGELKLSPRTIESSINDLLTVYRHATGKDLPAGSRLRRQRPVPDPMPLADIDSVWPVCDRWLQQWLVLSLPTCLRLSDCMALQLRLSGPVSPLRFTASKTGHSHVWPVPDWLRPWLDPVPLPFRAANDFAGKVLRSVLASACKKQGLPKWLPKHVRQRGITEWMRADGTAGKIVHGQGLGVLSHYCDPLTIIEPAASRVRLPEACGAGTLEDIAVPFSRLDPHAQRLVRETILRFA